MHSSAFARYDRPPITVDAYRPSHVLKKNETVTCAVYAHERWNATGFYLEKGEYSFQAKGQWLGGRIAVGPGGTHGYSVPPLHNVPARRVIDRLVAKPLQTRDPQSGSDILRRASGPWRRGWP